MTQISEEAQPEAEIPLESQFVQSVQRLRKAKGTTTLITNDQCEAGESMAQQRLLVTVQEVRKLRDSSDSCPFKRLERGFSLRWQSCQSGWLS